MPRVAALLLTSRAAVAEPSAAPAPREPLTTNTFQFGLGFRYGLDVSGLRPNPWGLGLGLDAGYTTRSQIYIGANAEYFFGGMARDANSEATTRVWQVSAEGGYDLGPSDAFVIRPKLGLGLLGGTSDFCLLEVGCEDHRFTKPLLAPGATFMLFTGKAALTADLRLVTAPTDLDYSALSFSFGLGF